MNDLPPVPRPPTREEQMEAKAFPSATPTEQEQSETRLAELRAVLATLEDLLQRFYKLDDWSKAWFSFHAEVLEAIGHETKRSGGNRDEV